MDSRSLGLLVIAAGVAVIIIGALIWFGGLGWFGRLPGDIRVESGNTRVYVPIVSMLIISIVLSILLSVIRRFFS